ncbi:hypothetical protein CR513_34724, partial [Mucuna pruriens]
MSTLLEKYGVVHRVATAYHPQINEQANVFNREIECILQKVAHPNRKDWSQLLEDVCHLLVEIEHHAYWTVKRCNLAFDQVGKERKLQLQELEELHLEAYENSKIYKLKVKCFHDNMILRKKFKVDQKMLEVKTPHKHLKEFHVVCSTMRPHGIPKDYIKMKTFPFSLVGAAKDWLYLQPVLFNTWGDMKRIFLEKFFLASRTTAIKKEICGIRQHTSETLYEH